MAALVACNVMLFAPFTLNSGNPDEFSVSLPTILVAYAIPALLVVFLIGAAGTFIPSRGFPRFMAFLAELSIQACGSRYS